MSIMFFYVKKKIKLKKIGIKKVNGLNHIYQIENNMCKQKMLCLFYISWFVNCRELHGSILGLCFSQFMSTMCLPVLIPTVNLFYTLTIKTHILFQRSFVLQIKIVTYLEKQNKFILFGTRTKLLNMVYSFKIK